MKLRQRFVILAIAVLAPVAAQGAPAQGQRYTMTPTENGFLRLDTQTGAVSMCKTTGDKVACELAADSHDAYQRRLDDLKRENEQLRAEVKRLEQHFGLGPDPDPSKPNDLKPPVPPSGAMKIPREEDVDQMFNYIEGMLKKFRERIRRLEKQSEPERQL